MCGFLLNALESEVFSEEALIAQMAHTPPAFFLYRYRGLRLSDFAEDISTINPQELQQVMAGPQPPLFEEQEGNDPDQQMNQLMHFLNQ